MWDGAECYGERWSEAGEWGPWVGRQQCPLKGPVAVPASPDPIQTQMRRLALVTHWLIHSLFRQAFTPPVSIHGLPTGALPCRALVRAG